MVTIADGNPTQPGRHRASVGQMTPWTRTPNPRHARPTHPMKPRQEVSAMATPPPITLTVDATSLDTLRALTQSINEATQRLHEATDEALKLLTAMQGAQEPVALSALCQVCGGSGLAAHNPDERDTNDQCPTCLGEGTVTMIRPTGTVADTIRTNR